MKGLVLKQWEVQATQDGRKSRLTRIMKIQPAIHDDYCQHTKWFNLGNNEYTCCQCGIGVQPNGQSMFKSSYQVGDILYVKETFFQGDILNQNEDIEEWGVTIYAAGPDRDDLDYTEIKWRPSMHMPEDVARTFLKVTGVMVEKLQDIEVQGAKEEGTLSRCNNCSFYNDYCGSMAWCAINCKYKNPEEMVSEISSKWNKDHKKNIDRYGWDANPWVFVYEFERISKEEAYGEGN